MKYLSVIISKLTVYSLLFPYLGFLESTDIQPTSLLLLCICVIIEHNKVNISKQAFSVFALLVCMILIYSLINVVNIRLEVVSIYLCWLLQCFLLYTLLKSKVLEFTHNQIFIVVLIYTSVGIVQFISPDFLASAVTRSVEAALSYSSTGRGVRSLTGEPAQLGKVYILLTLLFVTTYVKNFEFKLNAKQNRNLVLVVVLFFLFNLFISRSAYSIGIHFVVTAFILLTFNRKALLLLILSSTLSIFAVEVVMYLTTSETRIVAMFTMLFERPEQLLEQGAFRRVWNIPISLAGLYDYGIWGSAGESLNLYNSIWTPFGFLQYIAYGRNLGGLIELILLFGIVGIPIISVIGFMFFKRQMRRFSFVINGRRRAAFWGVILPAFFIALQDGSVYHPIQNLLLIFIYVTFSKSHRFMEQPK
jgi:hypothetical protein